MFEEKYIIMETIGRNSEKMTSIVKNRLNNYFIAKKVRIDDKKTMHQINLMKSLHHPNIISLHQIIEEEKWAYIIEEYCEEGDLQYHLRRQIKMNKFLPEDVVSRWMLQILLAVEYLHYSKIIHRDIRPKNIFLTSNGNIKLGSFKTSKKLEEQMCYAQTLINSPYYMSPELLDAKNYDCKVDIWAFGCVLFQICSLKPPLSVINLADLLNKQAKGKVDELPFNFSKQLNLIYQKCMKKNPNERLSAKQLLKTNYFLEAIERFIRDQGLNITLGEKIPIKRYKIHMNKFQKLKLKRGLVKNHLSLQKKEGGLPKIQIHSNKIQRKVISRGKSRQKGNNIQTPVIKRTTESKQKVLKSLSTDRKKTKTQTDNKMKERKHKIQQIFKYQKVQRKQIPKQKKLMMAPPILPKPVKKTEKNNNQSVQQKFPTRAATTVDEAIDNFETTMSKQQLSKQLVNFQQKGISQITSGLSKIFQNLNISQQDDEIQFNFQQDSELRLTNKQNNNQAVSLLQTCKSKLQQLIEEINYKYCPDMQPIVQKTTQFDSSQFSRNHGFLQK